MHLNVFLLPMSIKQDEEKIIQETSRSHRPLNCKGPCQTLTAVTTELPMTGGVSHLILHFMECVPAF